MLANSQVSFVILSDVWLDHPRTIPALKRLLEGYAEAVEYRPMAFVLCGNFTQRGWESEGGMKRYTSESPWIDIGYSGRLIRPDGFNALTDLLLSFPLLHSSHWIFVPGPLDPWSSATLPRPPIPTTFTSRLTSRIPKARFVSNPCRIRYFGMELVICREDLMGRMMRNLVAVKEDEGADMKRYVGADGGVMTPTFNVD